MAWLATGVAATAGATSGKTKRRAVSLDVTQTLTVVALFGWGNVSILTEQLRWTFLTLSRPWEWAPVGLVALNMSALYFILSYACRRSAFPYLVVCLLEELMSVRVLMRGSRFFLQL